MSQFHAQKITEVSRDLQVDIQTGLTAEEARRRKLKYGSNKLPEAKPPAVFIVFIKQFHNLFTYILLAAAIISFLLHGAKEVWPIFKCSLFQGCGTVNLRTQPK